MSECFICQLPLEEQSLAISTVKEKGISAFLEASKKRKDGKGVSLKGQTSVRVHEKCRKSYTDERSIVAFLKKREEVKTATPQITRSAARGFSFTTHCLICGDEITDNFLAAEYKKSPYERDVVYQVRDKTQSLRTSIMKDAHDLNDENGRAILCRIEHALDLVACNAQYHQRCRVDLSKRAKKKHHQHQTNVVRLQSKFMLPCNMYIHT